MRNSPRIHRKGNINCFFNVVYYIEQSNIDFLFSKGLTKDDVEKIATVISEQLKEHEKRRLAAEAEEAEEVSTCL